MFIAEINVYIPEIFALKRKEPVSNHDRLSLIIFLLGRNFKKYFIYENNFDSKYLLYVLYAKNIKQ